jgi:hypothetical protein
MKTIISILLLVFCATIVNAQKTFTEQKSFNFDVSSGEATGLTITVEGKTFDLFTIGDDIMYVKCISKEGKEYPLWIGYPTEDVYNEYPVFQNKKGDAFCIFKLSKSTGYPYPVWLQANSN